jgi:acetyl esterase/lipase
MSPLTLPYKDIDNIPIHFDLYTPQIVSGSVASVPAIVYFHGGGLTVGNRTSWLPEWLKSQSKIC